MSDVKYTQVAARAVGLADLFHARFEQGLAGPVRFHIQLSAPEGPSTAGGKQALQHIKLVPDGGSPAIVIGSANTTRQLAEIRTFDHIAALFAQRFRGARIPVDPARYQELAQALAQFFKAMQMNVTWADARSAGLQPVPMDAGGGGRRWVAAILATVVGLGVIGAAYWAIFLRG